MNYRSAVAESAISDFFPAFESERVTKLNQPKHWTLYYAPRY